MPIALQRLWVRLTADRRRFGAFVLVLVVGMLLWARIIVVSNPPRKAVATPETSASSALADVSQDDAIETYEIALADEPTRNPFAISADHFPKPNFLSNSDEETGKSDRFSADDAVRAELQRTAAIEAASKRLSLEAVMKAAQLAVIDGQMCRVGDTVESRSDESIQFTVIEIQERSVTLESEGRQIKVQITTEIGE